MSSSQVRRVNIHGMLLQFAFWFAICTYFSFIIATLVDYGWTPGDATMSITAMSAVIMFMQPVYGYVSDKFISEKKLCVLFLFAGGVLFFLFPLALSTSGFFVVAVMIGISVTAVQTIGLMDAWIVGLRQENESVNYGLMRGTGALAFALSAQISGMVTEHFSHTGRFWMGGAFFLLATIIALSFRRAKRAVDTDDNRRERHYVSKLDRESVFVVFRVLLSCRKFRLLLAVAFFLFLSNAPIMTLIQLLVSDFGGGTAQIGTAVAIMAGTEVPFMFMAAFLIRKIGFKRLFVLCGLFYFIRLSLMIFVTDVPGLILVQLLQGVTFAVILPVAMSYLAKIVDESRRGVAVTTMAAVSMSLTGILANLVTSRLLAAGFTAQNTVIFFAVSAFIGFALAVYGLVRKLWTD